MCQWLMRSHLRKFRHKNQGDDLTKEWAGLKEKDGTEKLCLMNEILARSYIAKLALSKTWPNLSKNNNSRQIK